MRLSVDDTIGPEAPPAPAPSTTGARAPGSDGPASPDPSAPDLSFLKNEFGAALKSFFNTIDRIERDNPVEMSRLQALGEKATRGALTDADEAELRSLKLQAIRQGRAVGAVLGFFLKFRPYPMLEEIRQKTKVFQPAFGPLLVVDGDAVRDVLERNQEFTVDPYGVEMMKVMSPAHNGGFNTFVLSTDDSERYLPDKRLLAAVCNRDDATRIRAVIHEDCRRRVHEAVSAARASGVLQIDVVQAVARYVPVTLGDRYLAVPVAAQPGSFELTPDMLTYYGTPIPGPDGSVPPDSVTLPDGTTVPVPDTALAKADGVIPDERQMYEWIKAAFQHFFNNVQKDPMVQGKGLRAARQLLAYLLREIGIQRQQLSDDMPVADTMLTRLLRLQMGRAVPGVTPPPDLDPRLISDLRIAENVMGTIVGAVAGQEEATCRVVDSLIRLKDGEYRTNGSGGRYGSFAEVRQLAVNVLSDTKETESRAELRKYFLEALRLQPQGEVLLRKCVRDGAQVAASRPISPGTLVFVSHGSAMKDIPEPDAFVLDRPPEHYLQYGWGRHTCLGQYVSPVIIVESMIVLLGLEELRRPEPRAGDSAFPFERRFGRFQLDDQNLYATTFVLQFADSGTTRRFCP